MDSLQNFIFQTLTAYRILAVLIGSFFFGETVVLTALILAFRLNWSILEVFSAALFGTILSDWIWYLFGMRINNFFKDRNSKFYKKYEDKLSNFGHILHGKKPFLILLYIKFLYGTRILTLIYLSIHKVRLFTVMLFDTIGTALYLFALMFLAYFVTLGVDKFIPIFHELTLILTAVFISLILFRVFILWLTKITQKK